MSEPAWVPIGPAAVLDVGPEVAYQEFTAGVQLTGADEASATPVVTAPAFVADGSSAYLVEFYAPSVQSYTQQVNSPGFSLFVDGVSVGQWGNYAANLAAGGESDTTRMPVRLIRRIVLAAGARTLSCRGWHTGSAAPYVYAGPGGAGQLAPGFIRVSKIPSAVPGPSGLVPPTAIGTVLPASPVDGQEFILTDSLTAPTYTWHLRYMAAKASNRWVFVGGAPGFSQVDALESPGSTTYVNLATLGPQFQIPVAGDYLVEIGFSEQTSTTGQACTMSYAIGATPASDTDAITLRTTGSANGDVGRGNNRVSRKSLGAVLLQAKYRAFDTNNAGFEKRWMRVEPIAVGG